MYKKAAIFVFSIFVILLTVLLYQFINIQYRTIEAVQKVKLLNIAADNFIITGYSISIITWIMANTIVIKSKQFFWIWIPFLFLIIVSFIMVYFDECIFALNKQNGLWKGGFSLSYIASGIIIVVGLIFIEINYFVLKFYLTKKRTLLKLETLRSFY